MALTKATIETHFRKLSIQRSRLQRNLNCAHTKFLHRIIRSKSPRPKAGENSPWASPYNVNKKTVVINTSDLQEKKDRQDNGEQTQGNEDQSYTDQFKQYTPKPLQSFAHKRSETARINSTFDSSYSKEVRQTRNQAIKSMKKYPKKWAMTNRPIRQEVHDEHKWAFKIYGSAIKSKDLRPDLFMRTPPPYLRYSQEQEEEQSKQQMPTPPPKRPATAMTNGRQQIRRKHSEQMELSFDQLAQNSDLNTSNYILESRLQASQSPTNRRQKTAKQGVKEAIQRLRQQFIKDNSYTDTDGKSVLKDRRPKLTDFMSEKTIYEILAITNKN